MRTTVGPSVGSRMDEGGLRAFLARMGFAQAPTVTEPGDFAVRGGIIDIYPLLMAGLLVPMGTLADRIGNRRLLLTGLVIFGVSSLLAAFAPTPAMLIGARVLLALGGAMIMPCVLGTIRRTFEDQDERAMALGLWHANTKKPISIND